MEVSLARTEEGAKAYWNTLSAYEQELLETNDEEINNESNLGDDYLEESLVVRTKV